MLEQEGDEQSPDAAIAVEIRVDGLELDVSEADPHERRERVFGVEVPLEVAEQRRDFFGRRWNERGVARPGAADPVLAMANLARLLVGGANVAHEAAVGPMEEAHRKRQSLRARELTARVLQGVEVVAHLADILERLAVVFLGLVLEEVHERRLRALDLRGEDCLFPDECGDEPIELGKRRPSARLGAMGLEPHLVRVNHHGLERQAP